MRLLAPVVTALVSFSLLDIVSATSHARESVLNRHLGRSSISHPDSISARRVSILEKRFENAKFSFYDAGRGACGKVNTNADFIVAMNTDQFAGGSHCFEMISISYKGKTTQAQIVDRCPGCPFGGLDFSRGLFDFFASESEGIIYGSWIFGSVPRRDDPPPPPPPPPILKPVVVWKPEPAPPPPPPPPEPTTTQAPPPPTTSEAPPPPTTTIPPPPPPSSIISSSTTLTPSPSPSPFPLAESVLAQLNLAFIGLGAFSVAAAVPHN